MVQMEIYGLLQMVLKANMSTNQAGKGDAPRNVGKKFRDNYDDINWHRDAGLTLKELDELNTLINETNKSKSDTWKKYASHTN